MTRIKSQPAKRLSRKTQEVQSVSDVKELTKGRSDISHCVHYAPRSTKLKRVLERIKSSSWNDFRCQICEKVFPPMKRKGAFSESTLRWVCLYCEKAFCGSMDNCGPDGDIAIHFRNSNHPMCTLLDMLSLAWCFVCEQQNTTGEEEEEGEEENEGPESAMDVDKEATEMIQPEVSNSNPCKDTEMIEPVVLNSNVCYHFNSTKLKQMLERMKPSSSCQKCGEEVMTDPDASLWFCFDCEKTFCGDMGVFAPRGHVIDHAEPDCHQLCIPLDDLKFAWCNICNGEVDLRKVVEGEQKIMKDPYTPLSMESWFLPGYQENSDEWFLSYIEKLNSEEVEFDGELFASILKKSASESKTESVVKKLPNTALNCYFNSVLQNLFAMDRLQQRFACLVQPGGDVTKELKRLFAESCDDSIQEIYPLHLRKLLYAEGRFLPFRQEDSHELLLYLLGKLESENKEFVNELFQGELISDVRCTRCGNISRTSEALGVLSLQLPMNNMPPATEWYRDQVKRTVRRPLFDEHDEGNESGNAQTSSNYPEGSGSYDSLGYNLPGASDSLDAAHDSDKATLTELTGKCCVSKHQSSLSGKVDTIGCKKDSSEPIMVSDHNIMIDQDVGADIGVVESDVVCEADNMNGLSIERCLDLFTKTENISVLNCNNCQPESQRQQKPSEKTDSQEDGVKSGCKKASGLPSDMSDQKNVGPDGQNLVTAPGSSQDDPETKWVKATKQLLIKRPPTILVIHLKRYCYTEKRGDHVIFKEKLDLTPYVDNRF